MSCGVGQRCGSDLTLLWLWCRQVAAAAMQPLAWVLPCAESAALKRKKKKKNKKKTKTLLSFPSNRPLCGENAKTAPRPSFCLIQAPPLESAGGPGEVMRHHPCDYVTLNSKGEIYNHMSPLKVAFSAVPFVAQGKQI